MDEKESTNDSDEPTVADTTVMGKPISEVAERTATVSCDNCGMMFAVRPAQAVRLELYDCPVCRTRHYSSEEAVAASLKYRG